MRVAVAIGLSLATIASAQAAAPAEVRDYLGRVGFGAADLQSLEAGQVIARSEIDKDAGEMVAIAAVKIRAPRDRTVAYYGEMVKYVDGKVTLGFGPFSTPPALSDVARLAFDAGEIDQLRSCTPGHCDVRIGGAGINGLRSAVDWNASDYVERANDFIRQAAVRYVGAYQEKGDAALVTYDDSDQPVSLQQEWKGIVASSRYFQSYAPELRAYLEGYPANKPEGARDVLYWVKEKYGALGTVVSLVHAVIYQPPSEPDRVLVAQKQIYASHYYDASLAVASLTAAEEGGRPVTYLTYVNRSRGSMLEGGGGIKRGLGGLKRTVAKDQASKSAEQTLGTIQAVLERAYANQP